MDNSLFLDILILIIVATLLQIITLAWFMPYATKYTMSAMQKMIGGETDDEDDILPDPPFNILDYRANN
jgi:hypothetical protein